MYYWGLKSDAREPDGQARAHRRWRTWSTARRSTRRSSSARPRPRARWSIPRRSTSTRRRSTCSPSATPRNRRSCSTRPAGRSAADGFRYKDGKKLELLLYSYTVGQNPKLSEVCRRAARKVGIDIKIQTWDPTVFFQKIAQQDYDIWTLSVPYTSAGDQMYLYYHSKNRPVPNRMMWADPRDRPAARCRPRRAHQRGAAARSTSGGAAARCTTRR